jgi:hypothetical protein
MYSYLFKNKCHVLCLLHFLPWYGISTFSFLLDPLFSPIVLVLEIEQALLLLWGDGQTKQSAGFRSDEV